MPNLTLTAYQDAELKAAREDAHRGFVVHLLITALVWIVLVTVNVLVAPEFPWAIFPIIGMSIGLFTHWHFGVVGVDTTAREHQREVESRAA